jgi:hypothetical protein
MLSLDADDSQHQSQAVALVAVRCDRYQGPKELLICGFAFTLYFHVTLAEEVFDTLLHGGEADRLHIQGGFLNPDDGVIGESGVAMCVASCSTLQSGQTQETAVNLGVVWKGRRAAMS